MCSVPGGPLRLGAPLVMGATEATTTRTAVQAVCQEAVRACVYCNTRVQ